MERVIARQLSRELTLEELDMVGGAGAPGASTSTTKYCHLNSNPRPDGSDVDHNDEFGFPVFDAEVAAIDP